MGSRLPHRDPSVDYLRGNARLAVTEACSNTVEHGYRDQDGTVHVEAATTESDVCIRVVDEGSWKPPQPESTGIRGRGLALIRALMPNVAVYTGSGGTSVELRVPLPA
ncbi:ATP-binding protein [Nocardia uniformis]|uniref:ATP-binding protein n=1 Tax=Nocardia uniformis TaxID=53432 RepID=A0A849CIA6_9NOCA|nr:ATP-binding protein [Nocardia uniformis]NNH75979.1 ATP-binding protein [Nocardia uniformis]